MNIEHQQVVILPGEKIQLKDLGTTKIQTDSNDFHVITNKQDANNSELQAQLSGLLWKKSIDDQVKIALIKQPLMYTDYFPHISDQVIVTIVGKTSEQHFCQIRNGLSYILNGLDFEGATKKNKPVLQIGSIVYARITALHGYLRGSLSCINPKSKKEWVTGESIFGELKNGVVFDVSLDFCNRLLENQKKPEIFKEIQKNVSFDVCIGKNGKIWINSEKVENSVVIINLLKLSDGMREQQQIEMIQSRKSLFV